jgi:acetyltransferase
VEKGREIFNRTGIPTFDTPERAVRAFMDLYHYSKNIELLQEIPSKLPGKLEFDRERARNLIEEGLQTGKSLLMEMEAKSLLSAYGIPVNRIQLAVSAEEAVKKAEQMGFPVVMKIYSQDITHKTDAGGVQLNLQNESDVRDAFAEIMTNVRAYDPTAEIKGVTLQPMFKFPDYELIIGSKKDRDFGPVILFGMGGIMTEILKDRSIAFPPLNRLLARRLMEETKIYEILKGYRSHPPADLVLLEEILVRTAQLVTDFPEIEELDINPLMISKSDACAVDARVLVKPSQIRTPFHLVISPYPDELETHAVSKEGDELFIRPIRPEDAPLLVELFESLSPRSVYMRFFTPMKRLSPSLLARFTQIDYDREVALVALAKSESGEKMLGVSRVIVGGNRKTAEFSVITGDPWHGKGIGAELLKRCLVIARERGIETVWGVVLSENTQMLALGRKLGFSVKRSPDFPSNYELKLDLKKNDGA